MAKSSIWSLSWFASGLRGYSRCSYSRILVPGVEIMRQKLIRSSRKYSWKSLLMILSGLVLIRKVCYKWGKLCICIFFKHSQFSFCSTCVKVGEVGVGKASHNVGAMLFCFQNFELQNFFLKFQSHVLCYENQIHSFALQCRVRPYSCAYASSWYKMDSCPYIF